MLNSREGSLPTTRTGPILSMIYRQSLFQIFFWLAASALFYVYAGYPLLLAVLSCLSKRRRAEQGYAPCLSVLIAAYNEEGNIQKKIEQTLSLDYPQDRLEIAVVSDGSTDRTDEIVRWISDPRVRLIRVEGRRGKTRAQNEAVKICKGEVIVFSDATTTYHPQALRYLAANYVDPRIGAVSGRYQYFDGQGNSPTGLGTIAFWNYENTIKRYQSSISTVTGCCGCIYSVRKSAYTDLHDDVISDLVQPLRAIQKGYRVAFEERALAYEETTQTAGEEFKMRVRVVTRGIRGVLSVPDLLKPWKYPWISFQLWSHKVLRWSVPLFLLTMLLSNAFLLDRPLFRMSFGLQAAFYLLALLSLIFPLHQRWKPLGVPLYFCTLNAAALVSGIEVLRGRKYVVWETVRT
jgi:cellulose synthase/poly-beta-1,6-N-acetylglucosamine synthase-like glycosyltransferase